MIFLLNQFILAFCNLINSRVDAYRIMKNKTIAHALNLSAYLVIAIILYYFTVKPELSWVEFPYVDFAIYLILAFCNRQISFDIPLNLRRHLDWFYQSTANPPAAWWDRIERMLFPDNDGKKIVLFYSIMWCVSISIKFLFL